MRTLPRLPSKVCLVGFVATALGVGLGEVGADEQHDKALAQQLFLDGRQAIDANDWQTGCPKVRQSLELFAVANSHFTVAQCDEKEGHIAAALDHWERGVALVDDRNDPRTKVGKDRIAALEPRVPRIRVVMPPKNNLAIVSLDGADLTPSMIVAPLRVEPGNHVFVVRAPGRQNARTEINVAERERTEFVANVGAPKVADVGPVGSSTAPVGSAEPPPPPPPMPGQKVAGFVIGGIGAASLLISAGTGAGALSAHNDLDELHCAEKGTCPPDKVSAYQSLFLANAVTFGVGVAGVGAGLILILTAPKASVDGSVNARVVPLSVPGGAGIGLSGRF